MEVMVMKVWFVVILAMLALSGCGQDEMARSVDLHVVQFDNFHGVLTLVVAEDLRPYTGKKLAVRACMNMEFCLVDALATVSSKDRVFEVDVFAPNLLDQYYLQLGKRRPEPYEPEDVAMLTDKVRTWTLLVE